MGPAGGLRPKEFLPLQAHRTQMASTLAALPGGNLSYDANDRLTSDMYDANGNTISSGGISFAYNFQNQLVQSGGLTATYDGDGNRVNETVGGVTTQYLIDTLNPTGLPQVMDELQNGAVTRTYAYGLERISEGQLIGGTWTPSFYGYDGHGSTRLLTDAVGSVTDTYQYDAFGNVISSTGTTPNNYLFAGEQFDPALGFYYMRARYYRPATGRFWTMDPVWGKLCCGLSWNPYIYGLDNPVNSTDPTGREAFAEYLRTGPFLGGPIILPPVPILSFPAQNPGPQTIEQQFTPTLPPAVCAAWDAAEKTAEAVGIGLSIYNAIAEADLPEAPPGEFALYRIILPVYKTIFCHGE